MDICFPRCFWTTEIIAQVLLLICSFMSSRLTACHSSAKEFANDVWLGVQGEINRCFSPSFVISLLVNWLTTAGDKQRKACTFPECDTIVLLVSPTLCQRNVSSDSTSQSRLPRVLCNFSGRGEGVWDLHFNPGLCNVCPLTIWARHHFNGMYSDKANKVSGWLIIWAL